MATTTLQYHVPETLDGALGLLAEHGAAAWPLAGGTDIVPALKLGVLRARHLVSLRRVPGLREIRVGEQGELVLGALVTLREVATSALVRSRWEALADAAGRAGSAILRNRGTLGGNVCLDTRCWYYNQSAAWRASRPLCQKAGGEQCYVNERENRCVSLFSADTPPVLLVAGATVTLAAPTGTRTVPLDALYSGEGRRPLAKSDTEILTMVTVPRPPSRSGTAYSKWSARDSIDFPVLGVAARVDLAPDGTIADARVALTGATSAPLRLPEVGSAVRGRLVPAPDDAELAKLATRALGPLFLSDTVPHKRSLAGLITVEALARAGAAAGGRRPA